MNVEAIQVEPENWLSSMDLDRHFDMNRPLEVDMGCGKGRFLLSRAAHNPATNYLGVDRILKRVRKIARKAVRRNLSNIRLLRADGFYTTMYLIPASAVAVYYIFFPDPWPKKKHYENRLFNGPYLDALIRTLTPGGAVHVATDHGPYFEEIEQLFENDSRFERTRLFIPEDSEKTDFELLFIDEKPIGRCSFRKKVLSSTAQV